MKQKNIFFSTSILILLLLSCASSMTPIEVNNTLPTLTKSIFFNQTQATEAIKNNKCKVLVKGRNYVAPMGFTVKEDLKNGATQLHIDFDTMQCQ